MEAAVFLITLFYYGLAIFLWWDEETPIYLLALLSGHIGVLFSPLWPLLYDFTYRSDLIAIFSLLGHPLPATLFIAAAWYYSLPALIVLYLYSAHWWFSGYFTGIITYGVFLFYHTIFESIGLRSNFWLYTSTTPLPLGLSSALISTLMSALISLVLLYLLLLIHRSVWGNLAIVLLPATLGSNLFVRGLLGAPFWITLKLGVQDWMVSIGALSTLILLAWAIHIVAWGMSRIDPEMA